MLVVLVLAALAVLAAASYRLVVDDGMSHCVATSLLQRLPSYGSIVLAIVKYRRDVYPKQKMVFVNRLVINLSRLRVSGGS
jgi:hypothetical protein